MFGPTNKKEVEIDEAHAEETNDGRENHDGIEDADDEIHADEGDALTSTKFDKDKVKYGQEVKFHYLIKETGEMGKPLPNLMKLENAYPGEPKFLRKRRHPKSLRFYKVKQDL